MANPVCTTKKGKKRPQYETKPTLELDERLDKKNITGKQDLHKKIHRNEC